jgi:thioredoxin-like negative regulator of GroEL
VTVPDVLCHWAGEAISAGDYAQATNLLNLVSLRHEDHPRLRALTARLHWAQGDHETARRCLLPRPGSAANDAAMWCELVGRLIDQGEPELAVEAGHEALRVVPSDSRLLLLLARLEAPTNPGRALGLLFRLKRFRPGKEAALLEAACLVQLGRVSDARNILHQLHPEGLSGRDRALWQSIWDRCGATGKEPADGT